MNKDLRGIGMTSQRARDRLARELRRMGIDGARDEAPAATGAEAVLAVLRDTPRHIFVDEALASRAYDNTALPIGYGQTISQPYIVARMTAALLCPERARPGSAQPGGVRRALEVGAGCGYQTAILSRLVGHVYSIERIAPLLDKARRRLATLGCRNVTMRCGDGAHGWPEHAPFDGILVAAAAEAVPLALARQLSPTGRLIIPVGRSGEQELLCVTRAGDGFAQERLDRVSFVPMIQDAWDGDEARGGGGYGAGRG